MDPEQIKKDAEKLAQIGIFKTMNIAPDRAEVMLTIVHQQLYTMKGHIPAMIRAISEDKELSVLERSLCCYLLGGMISQMDFKRS